MLVFFVICADKFHDVILGGIPAQNSLRPL
jgi:hypothetical protein